MAGAAALPTLPRSSAATCVKERDRLIAACCVRDGHRPMVTLTQSIQIIGVNGCFRRKPQCGFRDRGPTPLMTSTGWEAA